MAKLADAADLKSADSNELWGFKSPSRHHKHFNSTTYRRPCGLFATAAFFAFRLVALEVAVGTTSVWARDPAICSTAECKVLGARCAYRAVIARVLCPARS